MPVSLCSHLDRDARPCGRTLQCANPSPACLERAGKTLSIGLINNMPDAALLATERQFVSLLEAASRGIDVRLHRYSMPHIPRGATVAGYVEEHFSGVDRMLDTQLDALIMTGREPSAASLADEPDWDEFTRIVDWARKNTLSTIWSCLAAHAAVLHLDNVARRRRDRKYTGVYASSRIDDHFLMAGVPAQLRLPHSRWNGVSEQDLRDAGYTVLTRSDLAGVDIFVKQTGSLFVFFQGHPEYEAITISLEYRRDALRFLRGESERWPSLPHAYFDQETVAALTVLEHEALHFPNKDLAEKLCTILETVRPEHSWRSTAVHLAGNWLRYIGATKRLNLLADADVSAAGRTYASPEIHASGLPSVAQPANTASAASRAILTIL
jgi:homoserine O-succinyltransferase